MLIYIRGEEGVGKSKVVNIIEMDFSLLSRRKEFVISLPTGSIANDIDGGTLHTTLGINTGAEKNYQYKINAQSLNRFCLIIDKVSMIDLELLISVD